MIIFFRSCEANLSPGSMGNDQVNKPRWKGNYKLDIIRKCYMSIQEDIDENDHIVVVNDRTSIETLTWFELNTKAAFSIFDVPSVEVTRQNHPYPTYHPIKANSCTHMMELLVEVAANNSDTLIYICEDDYLHVPGAIKNMKTIFSTGYKGFYVPYDYPDNYTLNNNRLTELHAGPTGHLRTVASATLTMATVGSTWSTFKYDILRSGAFADDGWTWKAFQNSKCFCPIPGQATHLQESCITPFVDWEYHYNNIILP